MSTHINIAICVETPNGRQFFDVPPVAVDQTGEQTAQRFFLNGFDAVADVSAVAKAGEQTARLVIHEKLTRERRRRFWTGKLETGGPTRMGAVVILKMTEYETRRGVNLGVTIEVTRYFRNTEIQALSPTKNLSTLDLFGGAA